MSNDNMTREYVSPEPVYTAEALTTELRNVRIGDERDGRKVRNIKSGPKNTELFDTDGKRIEYARHETMVQITRYSETEESSVAGRRARRNRFLQQELATRTAGLDYAREKLAEQLDRDGYADYSRIQGLLSAQAELKLKHELVGIASAEKVVDLVHAEELLIDRLKDQLLQDFRHRAFSRSTSVVSNLMEDADREMAAKFIDRTRYGF